MRSHRDQSFQSPIIGERVRRIEGGFCFIPHRFLQGGFVASLTQHELVLYFMLVLAGNRSGVSFYGSDSLCRILGLERREYLAARNGLLEQDLIAFDGKRFQVLSLPREPKPAACHPAPSRSDIEQSKLGMPADGPATIRQVLERFLCSEE